MKRIRLGNKNLDIKSESLKRIVSATLACSEITRESVSNRASVSLSTAGKLLSALDECRFTELKYNRNKGIGSPSKQHVFSDDISVLILDLSSSVYTAYTVFGKVKRVICEKHIYDSSLSFENNIIVFLSNVGLQISKLNYSVSAICTVIADNPERISYTSDAAYAYIPRMQDLVTVNGYCARFFNAMPSLCLTNTEAITCAVRYNTFDISVKSSFSYIGISNSLNAFYLPKSASAISCNIDMLMIDNSTLFTDLAQRATTSADIAILIARCINFMSCAYKPDDFWVEIDLGRFSDIEKRVELFFRSAGLPLPHAHYVDIMPPATILGASLELMNDLICSHIKGV